MHRTRFALPRGGVITGRVVDEFGELASDVLVMAQRYETVEGRRRLMNAGQPATTTDIGEFRLFAIPPGQCDISATLLSMRMTGDSDDRSGYAPTCFPGTPNVAEAQRVTVGLGETVSEINIALMPMRTSRIIGMAVDSKGRPMLGAVMAILRGDMTMMMPPPSAQTKPDGSFAISGPAPGRYTLRVQSGSGDGEVAMAEVTASGDDVNGVQLVGSNPSTGRAIVDPAVQSLRPTTFRVAAQPAQADAFVIGRLAPAVVNDDWTFAARTRPARARIEIAGSPPGASERSDSHT